MFVEADLGRSLSIARRACWASPLSDSSSRIVSSSLTAWAWKEVKLRRDSASKTFLAYGSPGSLDRSRGPTAELVREEGCADAEDPIVEEYELDFE